MNEKTFFAPAERNDNAAIRKEKELLLSLDRFTEIFGAISGLGAVLDKNRQVVYANKEFIGSFGFENLENLLGKRPGEAISCIHSTEMPMGCGTSEACSVCGAVNAILESQKTGLRSVRETRITSHINGKNVSWDLKVTSSPLKVFEDYYYLLIIEDVSNEKRRVALERIFFHDILNIAGGLNGLLAMLKEGTDPEEARALIDLSEETSRNLIEEIMLHRQIRAAENGDLQVKVEKLESVEILNSAIGKIRYHESAKGKTIVIDDDSARVEFESDRILLQRVMINLLKNAIEATDDGGIVTAGCRKDGEKVVFYVKNTAVMPNDIKLQIFQRSFSTKGKGRGIGTYSIRLLTENYLNGKVSFVSLETEGTVFTVIV
jgi:nitrogen-specific signal transduction histidine kinase